VGADGIEPPTAGVVNPSRTVHGAFDSYILSPKAEVISFSCPMLSISHRSVSVRLGTLLAQRGVSAPVPRSRWHKIPWARL